MLVYVYMCVWYLRSQRASCRTYMYIYSWCPITNTLLYLFLPRSQTLGSLVEVSMPQNGIYHEGIASLAEAFGNNPKLEVMYK